MTTNSRHRKCAAVLTACLATLLSSAVHAQVTNGKNANDADDPFKARANPPAITSTQPAEAVGPLDVHLAIDEHEQITFATFGCPVIVTGNRVWNVRQGTIQAELAGKIVRNSVTAISDDGKYFAAASSNQEAVAVRVWSTDSGTVVLEVPAVPKRFVDLLLFSRNKYLIAGGRSTPDLQVWDIEQAKALPPINVNADRVERGKAAFSPDGQLFLAVVKHKLTLFRTATARPVMVMSSPHSFDAEIAAARSAGKPLRPGVSNASPSLAARRDTEQATFVYAWMQSLRFSPDGKEIAAVSTHPAPRLIVWGVTGQLLLDERLALPPMAFWEHTLQWLPDKSGWLVSGFLVDRKLKRAVLAVRGEHGQAPAVCLGDAEHLLGVFPSDPATLKSCAIPWNQIRQSIALMHDPAATLLGPSKPVSIETQLDAHNGGDAQASAMMVDALTKRLQREGIKIAAGQGAVFHLKFSETAGDTLPIFERQSPFDLRGHDTGQRIAERKGSLVIELTSGLEKAPLWRETLAAASSRSFREAINDASVRKSMLEALAARIEDLNLPYFIPKDERQVALPVVLQ